MITGKKIDQMVITNIFLFLFLSLSSCDVSEGALVNNAKITGYNFTQPDITFILPDTLHEISGLTELDGSTVACVQDENGIVFIYDIVNNMIREQHPFHVDGDYEGITRVGKTIYVLRSDGMLFEIPDYASGNAKPVSYSTGIPANNNEGLCYDPQNNRLLIACKSKIGKGAEYKDRRAVYAFDLETKALSKNPVYDFNLQAIKQFAVEQNINLPSRIKKKGQVTEPVIKFTASAIAIHPLTKKLFLLSSADHMLFVFDNKGNIEHIELLDPVLFNKSEGITFLQNGDLLITNEGQDKKPTLLRFNYQKQ
jgi:uncharacterized protein YjiK